MTTNASIILLVLPELFQLVLINVLLVFAMMFSSTLVFEAGAKDAPQASMALVSKAVRMTPLLQVQPVIQLVIVALICSAALYLNQSLHDGFAFGLIWDDLGRFMSIFLCISAAATYALGTQALKRFGRYEFVLILWLSLMGMLCLIKSYSFLALYLSIELQSLSFYMLAAMRSRTEASSEAGLKYFILSAFSSAMLLLGMALIYGAIGSQTFGDLDLALNHMLALETTYAASFPAITIGLGSICVSLLFKLAAAPFHAWIADVYEGSPMPITAWFAITAKIAVATALIRINAPDTLVYLLMFAAAASLLVGSLSAMRQVKLKRFVAFSAVANAGWFILALNAGQWQLMVLHLMVYTILSVNLFSVFILPLYRAHPGLGYRDRLPKAAQLSEMDHAADSSTIKYISDLSQIHKVNPSLAFAVAVSMFSLAGMPPLAGFYSKYLIISAATQSEQYLMLGIALAAAVMSAFYYIRVVKTIYFSSAPRQGWYSIQECSTNAYVTSLTTGLTLAFFIKPDYFCVWYALI